MCELCSVVDMALKRINMLPVQTHYTISRHVKDFEYLCDASYSMHRDTPAPIGIIPPVTPPLVAAALVLVDPVYGSVVLS